MSTTLVGPSLTSTTLSFSIGWSKFDSTTRSHPIRCRTLNYASSWRTLSDPLHTFGRSGTPPKSCLLRPARLCHTPITWPFANRPPRRMTKPWRPGHLRPAVAERCTTRSTIKTLDRIITGTGFVTRTCMIHSLVDSSSFSNVRTNDYRNVSYDSLEENPLEVGLQFQLRIRPSPMVSSRRFLFTLN